MRTTRFRFWQWVIGLIGVIVPRRLRIDWRQEWEAELLHREAMLAQWDRLSWCNRLNLLWRSSSAFWDALWLQRARLEDEMFQDLRFGARMLFKNPGFCTIAVVTLALGIGANTAIFSIINGVLLKPLAFDYPDRLLMIWTDNPAYQLGFHEFPAMNSDLLAWRATATSFQEIAAFQTSPTDLSDGGDPERVGGIEVTQNLLPTLGVQPAIGRQFLTEEEEPGKDIVLMISHELWQRRFAGDPEILGKTILVNSKPRMVIGIMPEGLQFLRANEMPQAYNLPSKVDVWVPLARDADYWQTPKQRPLVCLIGQLKRGVTQAQAQAEMDTISASQAIAYPATHEGWRVWLTPLFNQIVGQTRRPLLVLLGAVGFLLLIACANIASLLLARATARSREMAVRAALGAGRSRIIRQLLTESLLLSILGGGSGLLVGYWGLEILLKFIPANVPRLQYTSLDTRVLLFTALISILTGVLFGLVPAWQASNVNLAEALKEAGRASSTGRWFRSHSWFVTSEVALVTVLLIGAVLMLQSFRRLLAVDPGFKPEGVVSFDVTLPSVRYRDGGQRSRFLDQASERLKGVPGVRAVGVVSNLPLSSNESMNYFAVEGAEPVPRGKEPLAEDRVITAGYFDAMGMSLVSGRGFEPTDGSNGSSVAIVNETLARQFFSQGDAVGKHIKWVLGDEGWISIVGVVRDVRGFALNVQPRPQLYQPYAQSPNDDAMAVVVRADEAVLSSLRSTIQQELKQLDSAIPVANFTAMPQLVATSLARPRFNALLLGLFAVTALLLTAVGLYGVVAYGVNQRTREIGIRMALGARRTNVLSLAIRHGMQPALIGVCVGLAAAFGLMQLLTSLLFEVKPTDPVTFILVGCGLLVIAFAACYFPSRRATKVDPMLALRHE